MKTHNILLLLGAALLLPITLLAADPQVAWRFDIKEDDNGTPKGKVFLEVAGKSHLISEVTGNFHEVAKEDYKKQKIPANALTACRGTWAHVGKQFYVASKDDKLQVMMRDEDSEGGFIGKYELVKTIP